MSSTSNSSLGDVASIIEHETCRYRRCDETFVAGESDTAPYCSTTCRRRATASGLVDDVSHDPRFCANCFNQIKEIEQPGRFLRSTKVRARRWYVNVPNRRYPILKKSPNDPTAFFRGEIPDCVQPTRTPTRHTQKGPSDRLVLADPHPDTNYQTAMANGEGLICECGVSHHTTTDRPIKGVDNMVGYAMRLSDAVNTLYEEGTHDQDHDRDTLLDETRARKSDPSNHTPDQHMFINALAEAIQV